MARRSVLVIGPPLAGKSTWVRARANKGDLVYDFDTLHAALTPREPYDHDDGIKPYVLAARDAILGRAAQDTGEGRAWIISTSPQLERVKGMADTLGAEVMPLVVTADEAHRRADADKRPAAWHGHIDRWYERNDWRPADFAGRLYVDDVVVAPVAERMRSRKVPTIKPNDGIERRDMVALDVELRLDGDTGAPVVEGYAAVFDSLSEVMFEWADGRFREKVAPGAFTKTLREQNIPLLVEHANLPLATTGAGTLMLTQDARGLRFLSTLEPTDPDVQRLIPKMRRGDMNKCSFGFIPVREGWDDKAKPSVRTIYEARLHDVSIVARPAYPATEAKVRRLLADEGLDAEHIAEVLVRLRQGLELDADDLNLMQTLVETCQRHLPNATAPETAPGQDAHPVNGQQPAMPTSAPDPVVHPLSWYMERLAKTGA